VSSNPARTPAAFRKYAEGVPAAVREKISQAELDCRARHCGELAVSASSAPPEHYRFLMAQVKRIQTAMPYREFSARREVLKRNSLKPGSSREVRDAHSAAMAELDNANQYPPCMDSCLDAARPGDGAVTKSREEMLQIHRDALHLAADIAEALIRQHA
jgi:hypothetical protein